MSSFASRRPDASEFEHAYHGQLIDLCEGDCALHVLRTQLHWMCDLSGSISTEQVDRVHVPYQWTIRQVFEHCANCERMFGYRIMCVADGSQPDLPAWDENVSADSRFGLGNFARLIDEWAELRKANLGLLQRLVPSAWDASGTAAGHRVTVRTLAWLTAGHLTHHLEIVEKRCGVTASRAESMVE